MPDAAGQAPGDVVRLFTASRRSVQDGAPLGEGVAMSLVDAVVSDGTVAASGAAEGRVGWAR